MSQVLLEKCLIEEKNWGRRKALNACVWSWLIKKSRDTVNLQLLTPDARNWFLFRAKYILSPASFQIIAFPALPMCLFALCLWVLLPQHDKLVSDQTTPRTTHPRLWKTGILWKVPGISTTSFFQSAQAFTWLCELLNFLFWSLVLWVCIIIH